MDDPPHINPRELSTLVADKVTWSERQKIHPALSTISEVVTPNEGVSSNDKLLVIRSIYFIIFFIYYLSINIIYH